ncbi:reverse transcriptase domain-containing protein [Tanacetum coccineum]
MSTKLFSTPAISSDVAELKDMVRALILDRKNQTPASAPVKAVEQSCVTCGGGHSYQNCPATNSNMYHDNIQEYVSQAAAANFNQANSGYRPPMVSNQIRPPGFPPVQNPHANSQNNFNRGNNFNQNRGNNFNQGQIYRPPVHQPVAHQPVANQGPAPQTHGVSKTDFERYVTANDAVLRNMQNQGQNLQSQMANLTDMLSKFVTANTASTSGIGNLLGNNITTKGRFKRSRSSLKLTHLHDVRLADRSITETNRYCLKTSVYWGNVPISADCVVLILNQTTEYLFNSSVRCFLKKVQALIDVYEGVITFVLARTASTFNLDPNFKLHADYNHMTMAPNLTPFGGQKELKLCEAKTVDSSVDEPPEVELKELPPHLEYAFLEGGYDGHLTNDEDELIPTRLVMGWRLAGNEYYCFLDGFSGYFQIPINPKDQEKTTFTCPYGTFAYRRMPFGLCNAPGTFQRCMMAIFHDMIEKTMEVFMDDFSVFGDSFSTCLAHLEKMLKRCEDTNLSLNWEKSHFMVKEGICSRTQNF